ncbi:glutaredoxin family protein [Gilvimarinus sp. DA14]|uniref:glutaredoxin family protein n=1 Tax=Gilvimarinus sp. DA14 TaxID=2956798 RepID=UPI0020B6EFC8|nr:glutaredoxin family protein [Gilvimarinus sp. DA14]UTF58968.1 glutaredoxin family protein [Gilvimarinus sp. DA14]
MKQLFFLILTAAVLMKVGWVPNPFAPEGEKVEGYGGETILYATSWCGYCKKTRELLREHNIPYTEYDIEKSVKGERDYQALEGRGVPLMVINGEVVRGYDPRRILKLAKNL